MCVCVSERERERECVCECIVPNFDPGWLTRDNGLNILKEDGNRQSKKHKSKSNRNMRKQLCVSIYLRTDRKRGSVCMRVSVCVGEGERERWIGPRDRGAGGLTQVTWKKIFQNWPLHLKFWKSLIYVWYFRFNLPVSASQVPWCWCWLVSHAARWLAQFTLVAGFELRSLRFRVRIL